MAFRLLVCTQKQAGADEAGEIPQQPLTDPQATSELGLVPFLNLFPETQKSSIEARARIRRREQRKALQNPLQMLYHRLHSICFVYSHKFMQPRIQDGVPLLLKHAHATG